MTDREKVIVMAYTGVCMLQGEKLGLLSLCRREARKETDLFA